MNRPHESKAISCDVFAQTHPHSSPLRFNTDYLSGHSTHFAVYVNHKKCNTVGDDVEVEDRSASRTKQKQRRVMCSHLKTSVPMRRRYISTRITFRATVDVGPYGHGLS